MLVEVTQEKHHVPQQVKYLILDYYSKFSLRVSIGQLTSDWHQHQAVHMGQNRNTCMPPLFQNRNIRTHLEQLLQGPG